MKRMTRFLPSLNMLASPLVLALAFQARSRSLLGRCYMRRERESPAGPSHSDGWSRIRESRGHALLSQHRSSTHEWAAHSFVTVLPTAGRICLLCQVV